jgi:cytochrome c-type biogenesis protein CcmE
MSRIDEELKQALQHAEAQPGVEVAPTTMTTAEPPRRNIGLLITVVAIGLGILGLVMINLGREGSSIYSMGVDQLRADQAKFAGRNVRVEGQLVSGTLVRRNDPCEYRFHMMKGDADIDVHYAQCVVPDTFRDVKGVPVQVTAEGRIKPDGTFHASQIFAKCPSKYEMKQVEENTGVRPEHSPNGTESPIIPANIESPIIQPKNVDN